MIFLYFLPRLESRSVTAETLIAVGLADVARDCLAPRAWDERVARADVARGPDGSSGTIVALLPVNGENPTVGYQPARQTWRPVQPAGLDAPLHWIGWSPDDPPRPETLARDRLVSGEDHELGDGRLWHCPTLRRPNGKTNLPQRWGVDAAGRFAETLEPDYAAFWTLAGEMFEAAFGDRDWSRAETFAASVRCLGLNYRLGPHEVGALGLLTTETYPRVFHAAIDAAAIRACVEFMNTPAGQELLREAFPHTDDAAKKKTAADSAPDTMSSTPGPSDGCPITLPAAASCSPSPPDTPPTNRSP